jgi:hypothetical protein
VFQKGTRIRLDDGREATLQDNKKPSSRMIALDASHSLGGTESLGEVGAINIQSAFVDGKWIDLERTPQQRRTERLLKQLNFI